jgi:hypothetical protein
MEKRPDSDSVCVIESDPDRWQPHDQLARQSLREGHTLCRSTLRMYPELGRGAMGRIHPATEFATLLRPGALKRLDKELARQQFYRTASWPRRR